MSPADVSKSVDPNLFEKLCVCEAQNVLSHALWLLPKDSIMSSGALRSKQLNMATPWLRIWSFLSWWKTCHWQVTQVELHFCIVKNMSQCWRLRIPNFVTSRLWIQSSCTFSHRGTAKTRQEMSHKESSKHPKFSQIQSSKDPKIHKSWAVSLKPHCSHTFFPPQMSEITGLADVTGGLTTDLPTQKILRSSHGSPSQISILWYGTKK